MPFFWHVASEAQIFLFLPMTGEKREERHFYVQAAVLQYEITEQLQTESLPTNYKPPSKTMLAGDQQGGSVDSAAWREG